MSMCTCVHMRVYTCAYSICRVILLSTSDLCMLSHVCLTSVMSVMSFEIQRECPMPSLLQTLSNHAVKLPFLLLMNTQEECRICPL